MAATDVPSVQVRFDDDPDTVARQRADDYNAHVVPESGRVGRWQLTMSAWSTLSAMVWLFYGALVAGLYGTRQALIGTAVSIVLYSVVTPVYVKWTARTWLSSALLSRRMFGVVGSALTALLLAATTTYYTVFESSTLAVAMRSYTGHLNIKIWYLIVVALMIPLMVSGVQTWMARLNALLLPLYAIGLVAVVVSAAVRHGAHSPWASFPGIIPAVAQVVPGWVSVVVLYLGLALMMPVAADFGRFSRKQDTRFHQRVTFGGAYYIWLYGINGLAGIYLTQTMLASPSTTETGVVQAVLAAAGIWGLLFIIITQTRINSLNYYLASANWDRLVRTLTGRRLPRPVWVVIVSVVVFLLMLTDVFSYLQTALTWQGICLVGWVGIVGTHMAIVRADREHGPEYRASRLPAVSPGVAVWAISAGTGIWLVQDHGAPRTLAALAPVVVLALSITLYAATLLLWPPKVKASAHADPRGEVADPWSARIACDHCGRSYIAHSMDRIGSGSVVCDECVTSARLRGGSAVTSGTRT
jgi:purine-cytosine permease-like protein